MNPRRTIKEAKLLEPIMRIGKNGINDNVINDLKQHLEKRKIIKVKMLKSSMKDKDKKDIIQEIAEKTNSKVIQSVGFVFVLKKE